MLNNKQKCAICNVSYKAILSSLLLSKSLRVQADNIESPPYLETYEIKNENLDLSYFKKSDEENINFLDEKYQSQKFEEFKTHIYDNNKSGNSPWSQDFVEKQMNDQGGKNLIDWFIKEVDGLIELTELNNNKSPVNRYAQKISKEFWLELKSCLPKDYTFLKFDPKNRGICVRNAHIRILPTDVSLYYVDYLRVMGTLCDELQNDNLFLGEPVFIVYELPDKSWAFIISSTCCGWVKGDSVARISNDLIKKLVKNNNKLGCITKNCSAYFKNGVVCDQLVAGSVVPLDKLEKDSVYVIIPRMDNKGELVLQETFVKSGNIEKIPMKPSCKNFLKILEYYIGRPYNWGGEIYFEKDCSSLTKSIYTVFGIFLPRNSVQQANANFKVLDISSLDTIARTNEILKNAKKFVTLIWFPGHIMIYLGSKPHKDKNGNTKEVPVVFQCFSTLKYKKGEDQGLITRVLVGKTIISKLAEEYNDDLVSLIDSKYRKKYKMIFLDETNTNSL